MTWRNLAEERETFVAKVTTRITFTNQLRESHGMLTNDNDYEHKKEDIAREC